MTAARVGDDEQEVARRPRRSARRRARWMSRDRNLATGPCSSPSGWTARWTRPLAPNRLAVSVSSSISRRLAVRLPGTTRPFTRPPAASVSSNTRKPLAGAPSGIGQGRREVDELHREAHVRLVRAEPLHRLVVGEARERRLADRPVRDRGAGHLDDHPLDEVHHRLLGDEAHLEVELGELGLPVAARRPRRGSSGRSGSSGPCRRP